MALNWNLEIYTYFLSFLIFGATAIVLYKQYEKIKHNLLAYLIYAWFFFAIYCLLAAFAYLFLFEILFRITFIFLLLAAVFFTLGLDLFIGYSFDPKKMIVLGAIVGGTLFSLFEQSSVEPTPLPSGAGTFLTAGSLQFWMIFLSLFSCLIYFYYCLQIYLKSPPKMKSQTRWTLVGGTLFGIVSPIIYSLRLLQTIPGSMMIGFALGAFISGYSFVRDPSIMKMLIQHSHDAKIRLRQSLEEKLELSQERFKELVETMNEIIYEVDLSGKCTYANEAHNKILKYPCENLSFPNTSQWIDEKEIKKISYNFSQVQKGESVKNIKIHMKDKLGTSVPFLVNIAPKFDISKEKIIGYIIVARDIVNFEKIQKTLREKEDQLIMSQKMESIGKLAGGIAHDFNNLLQAIFGLVEFSLLEMEQTTCENKENISASLHKIKNATEQGINITSNLLALSRTQDVDFSPIKVNSEIVEISNILAHSLPKNIQIQLDLAENLENIFGNKTNIQQVIMNLAINARDAMADGGNILVKTQNVELDSAYCEKFTNLTPGHYILISVSDTGVGISNTLADHIFEPYYTTKPVGKGTGLGLSIVYNIIQQHQGSIQFYSEVDQGTSFHIHLPIFEITGKENVPSEEKNFQFEKQSGTIMIIDDEEKILEFTMEILKKFGYTVIPAHSCEVAIELLNYYEPSDIDLILVDYMMPQQDGIECIKHFRKILKNQVKYVLISGMNSTRMKEECKIHAVDGFLAKPFQIKELFIIIQQVLNKIA